MAVLETDGLILGHWTAGHHNFLLHLLDVAESRSVRARECAASLQERAVKVGGVSAVALGLVLNATGLLLEAAPASGWSVVGLVVAAVGILLLFTSLVLATLGFRPLGEPDPGNLNEWRSYLIRQGPEESAAALISRHEGLMNDWAPRLDRLATAARRAQVALAAGIGGATLGLLLLVVGRW